MIITNVNFPQSTALMKYTHIHSYKTNAKNDNSKFLGSDSSQVLWIYHQNICGLGSKTNDLLMSLYPKLPHILCLTEHHLKQYQIQHITMDDYILGAEFSRRSLQKGGVCIFIQKYFSFSEINIEKFCEDKELEDCTIRLDFLSFKICIMTVYRSPNGTF